MCYCCCWRLLIVFMGSKMGAITEAGDKLRIGGIFLFPSCISSSFFAVALPVAVCNASTSAIRNMSVERGGGGWREGANFLKAFQECCRSGGLCATGAGARFLWNSVFALLELHSLLLGRGCRRRKPQKRPISNTFAVPKRTKIIFATLKHFCIQSSSIRSMLLAIFCIA